MMRFSGWISTITNVRKIIYWLHIKCPWGRLSSKSFMKLCANNYSNINQNIKESDHKIIPVSHKSFFSILNLILRHVRYLLISVSFKVLILYIKRMKDALRYSVILRCEYFLGSMKEPNKWIKKGRLILKWFSIISSYGKTIPGKIIFW